MMAIPVHSQESLKESIDVIISKITHDKSEESDTSWRKVLEEEIEKIQATMSDVQTWKDKKSFSGRAIVGFDGATTRNEEDSKFEFDGGISMDWDIYPGQLDFFTSYGITFGGGTLQESVSKIDVSYDHLHPNVMDGQFLENYVYVNRSSNGYLGVDQRYEIGGGIILNHYIGRMIASGEGQFESSWSHKKNAEDMGGMIQEQFPDLSRAKYRSLRSEYLEGYNKYRKSNSKLRLGLLAGMYFELEQNTVLDSITLDAATSFRMTLRPTVDIHLNKGWKLKIRPYFKLPVPWDWNNVVVSPNGDKDVRADYYIDMSVSLFSKLPGGMVGIGFRYGIIYDNAPARTWYKLSDDSYKLLVNNDLHQSFKVALSVDLNRD